MEILNFTAIYFAVFKITRKNEEIFKVIKQGRWVEAEEKLLIEAQQNYGNNVKKIAEVMKIKSVA